MIKLNEKETKKVLDSFYKECLRFWEKEKERGQDVDPVKMAKADIKSLKHDPREPKGAKLDEETVKNWG